MAQKHELVHDDQDQLDDNDHDREEQYDNTTYQSCLMCCGNMNGCLRISLPCICCCCPTPVFQVPTSRLGVHQSFGRFRKILTPGFHLINPNVDNVIMVDMKTNVYELSGQQVITKDNVSMSILTIVYYRAVSPYKLVYKLRNDTKRIREFITEMSFAALRSVVGENTFQELLENRNKVADQLEEYVKEKISPWGLFIENIFIKDLILPIETQKNMQSAAIQKRVSEATIIEAKANVEAAKMLKETSEILNLQSAMQIRYLQTVQNITDNCGSKVLFMSLKGKE